MPQKIALFCLVQWSAFPSRLFSGPILNFHTRLPTYQKHELPYNFNWSRPAIVSDCVSGRFLAWRGCAHYLWCKFDRWSSNPAKYVVTHWDVATSRTIRLCKQDWRCCILILLPSSTFTSCECPASGFSDCPPHAIPTDLCCCVVRSVPSRAVCCDRRYFLLIFLRLIHNI